MNVVVLVCEVNVFDGDMVVMVLEAVNSEEVIVVVEERKAYAAARPIAMITITTATTKVSRNLELNMASPGGDAVDFVAASDKTGELLRVECLRGVAQSFFRPIMNLDHQSVRPACD